MRILLFTPVLLLALLLAASGQEKQPIDTPAENVPGYTESPQAPMPSDTPAVTAEVPYEMQNAGFRLGPLGAPPKGEPSRDRLPAAPDAAQAGEGATKSAPPPAQIVPPCGAIPGGLSAGMPEEVLELLPLDGELVPAAKIRCHTAEHVAAVAVNSNIPADKLRDSSQATPFPSAEPAQLTQPADRHNCLMPNGMLDPRVTSGTVNENRPATAIDSNGNIFIAYQYEYSTSDHDIYVAKSTDAGYTWTTQSVIADTYDQLSPSIAIDLANNYIYIAYRDNQYFKYAKSTDGGASWTTYTISSWTWYASASWPSIAAHNNYVWLACQYAFSSSDDDIRYVYSTNGGSSWYGYYSLAATTKNERYPALAMTSSRVGIAYQYEYSASDNDVYYKYNAGWTSTSWTAANIAASSVNERWPSASASPVDSYLYVGYTYAYSTSDDDIRCAWSSNGGTSWGATGVSVAASGYNDRYPSVAIDPVTRTRVYLSHYCSNAHIYYAYSTNNGQSWSNYIQATDQANAVDAQHTTSMAFRSYPRISWQDNRNAATHGLDIYYSTTGQNWTIQTAPTGLTFYVGGTPYTTPQTFAWPHGYTTTISTDSPQTLGPSDTRYVWNNWSQGGAISHSIVVTGTGDVTDQANFDTQYQVTLSAQSATGGTPMSATNYAQTWGTGPGTAAKLRWEEISTTGTEITSWYSVDDGFATSAFNIGFSFPYYGSNLTQFVPATNGYIALGSAAANQYAPYDVAIPYDTTIRPYMANTVYPFTDDLYWTSGTSKVYYQTLTSPQRLVIQYKDIDSFSPRGTLHTFETILYATGEIRFLYKTVGYEPGDIGLEGSSNVYYVNAPTTAISANATYVFQNGFRAYDSQSNALWVDGSGNVSTVAASSQSSTGVPPVPAERWQTQDPVSYSVTAPATHTLTYYNQLWTEMTATTAPGGLPMDAGNGATVEWRKFSVLTTPPSPGVVYDGYSVSDWADRASNLVFGAASTGSDASERWQANAGGTQPTYIVETPGALFSPQYWHQFKPTITLAGTAAGNTVSTEEHTFFASNHSESGLHTAWSDWCDRSTSTLTFSEFTTLGWYTTDTRSWAVQSAFSATVTYDTPPVMAQEPKNNAQLIGACTSTVYPHSGEFTWSTTDMTIPGRGFPFRFTRTYRSGSSYDGPLGFGWTHSFDERLAGSYGVDIILYDGTGRADTYTWDGMKYVAPAGFYDKLEYLSGPGTFNITDRYGTVRKFALKGTLYKLTEIKDRNDNAMTLNYDGSNRLSTIVDTLGRTITFTYTTESRIDYFTDFYDLINPRKVDFTYDGNGDLWKVISPVTSEYPTGKTTTYSYLSGESYSWLNHNLSSITDPKSQTFLVNTYNVLDKVTQQQYGTATQFYQFEYQSGKTVETDRNGNITDYNLTPAGNCSSKVEYTNRNVRPGEGDYTTAYEYNPNMELTKTTLPRGNTVNNTFDTGNADPLQRGNLLEIRRKDEALGSEPDIVTSYTYESTFNQVKTLTDPRGYVTTFYFDYEEATLGDLNGDAITTQDNGNVVKLSYPTVTLGQPRPQTIETKFWYNDQGQVTRAINPEDVHTGYEYYTSGDPLGYLWKVTRDFGGLGLMTEFAYDRVGNVTSTKDPRGNTTTCVVNELNQVTKTIAPAPFNYEVKHSYDENDNLVQTDVQNVDENGVPDKDNPWITTTYIFDVLDNMASRTEEVDHTRTITTTYDRDANESITDTTFPRGTVEHVEYDERDLVFKLTRGYGSPDAATDTTNYNGNRNASGTLDGEGHETTYTWDGFDRQTRATDPLGNYTESAYDAAENLVESTSRSATGTILTQATYQFDEVNRCFRGDDLFKDSAGAPVGDGLATRQYLHDRKGRKIATTDDNGNTKTCFYNAVDWLVKTVDALGDPDQSGVGNKVEYSHDSNGNVLDIAERQYNQATMGTETFVTSQTYDELNRRTTMTEDPAGLALTTAYYYDSRNNSVKTVDAESRATRRRFDAVGRLTSTTHDEGGLNITVSQAWDDNSRLASQTDANANTTSYTYNARDLQTAITYADSTTKTFVYNLDDTMACTTDQNGSVVTNTYDAANRITNRAIVRGSGVGGTDTELYQWDAANRMTRAENREGTTSISVATWTHDTLGNADSETQQIGTFAAKTISRVFDGVRNRTQLTYPSGRVIDYVPDALNRTNTIKEGSIVIADYYYGGQRTVRRDYANGIRLEATYNSVRDIVSYKHFDSLNNLRCGFEYAFTATHNKKYENRLHDGKGDVYRYDDIYQVTGAKYGVPSAELDPMSDYDDYTTWEEKEEFDFDGVGNRKMVEKQGFGGTPATTYYNHVSGIYTPDSMNEYYKTENPPELPVNRVHDSNGNLTDDGTFVYTYDYANRLLQATRKSDMTVVGEYGYSAVGMRIWKVASEATYFYFDNVRCVEERSASDTVKATSVYGNSIDEILTMCREGVTYYDHGNTLGSIDLITDVAAGNVEKYAYNACGMPTAFTWTGTCWQEVPETVIGNRLCFAGRDMDWETSLYFNRARYYETPHGRFMSHDAKQLAPVWNVYAYALNAPTRWIDPMGLQQEPPEEPRPQQQVDEAWDLWREYGGPVMQGLLDDYVDDFGPGLTFSWTVSVNGLFLNEAMLGLGGKGQILVGCGVFLDTPPIMPHALALCTFSPQSFTRQVLIEFTIAHEFYHRKAWSARGQCALLDPTPWGWYRAQEEGRASAFAAREIKQKVRNIIGPPLIRLLLRMVKLPRRFGSLAIATDAEEALARPASAARMTWDLLIASPGQVSWGFRHGDFGGVGSRKCVEQPAYRDYQELLRLVSNYKEKQW